MASSQLSSRLHFLSNVLFPQLSSPGVVMPDAVVDPSNMPIAPSIEREKEKTSQCNKGWSSSRQQETQESVLHQIEKNYFSRSQTASNSKENFFIKPR